MTLKVYAAPLRRLPVDAVGTDDVLSLLKPLWAKKHETASRLRGRIERALDAAKAQGLRSGENPARWRGHLASSPRRSASASRVGTMPPCPMSKCRRSWSISRGGRQPQLRRWN